MSEPVWFLDDPSTVWDLQDDRDQERVARWILQAETILEAKFPTMASRIEAGSLSVKTVQWVIEEMVTRAIDNDERGGAVTEQMPEWSIGYETGQGMGKGSKLFLTTDEFSLLAPPRESRGLGSLRMARSYEVTDPTPEKS
ncbi:hypothetical protein [Corynebacterium glutamicum]|uniref:hypothetical protein n=1 Tax=Corynebacterium glutamicum TaxID=1718 RepID=UPI0011786911|nr:hypothetical protein [Corynebacterium glutamicum]